MKKVWLYFSALFLTAFLICGCAPINPSVPAHIQQVSSEIISSTLNEMPSDTSSETTSESDVVSQNTISTPSTETPSDSSSYSSNSESETVSGSEASSPSAITPPVTLAVPVVDYTPNSSDYWYSHMNSLQKLYYAIIYDAMINMEPGEIFLGLENNNFTQNISVAYIGVTVDHPEIFWMGDTYQIAVVGDRHYIKLTYAYDKTERDSMKAQLDERVSQIISSAEGLTPSIKQRFYHDLLCGTVEYDFGGGSVYTSYGALVEGLAVCEGYSRAMQLLCIRSSMECTLVYGTANNELHLWNAVNLAGEWYNVDVTWDDVGNVPVYNYYNITDEQISKDHTPAQNLTTTDVTGVNTTGIYNFFKPSCTVTYKYDPAA